MKLKSDTSPAPGLPWDCDAEKALESVPFFVRKLVRRKVTERVAERGGVSVTIADFREAEDRYKSVSKDKSADELKLMMPADNEPGLEMAVLTACHSKLSGCPNALLDTDEWRAAVGEWIENSGINEKLRLRVHGKKVLFHHKLRISISGCPNGCSRPQIADIGIVGFVVPIVDPAECTFCGACGDVCPDRAIEVKDGPPVFDMLKCQGCVSCRDICPNKCIDISPGGVRILLGGKLGRHPHLAENFAAADTPAELLKILDDVVNDYISNGTKNERFSEYRIRLKGGGEHVS